MNREQVAQILTSTPETLRVLLTTVDPTLHTWRPQPEEWSINEIIGHLIDCDLYAFRERIEGMLAADSPVIPGVDVNALSAQRNDNERDVLALLDELAAQRPHHAEFVLSLTNEQMAQSGTYKSYGTFRVADFVYEWAYHDASHIQQILENLKSSAWPRFSDAMQSALSG